MKLGIGIDTGGTYTDAVLYDFESGSILGSAKSLTTKYDLSAGILGAIDGLPAELLRQARVVSLSTTLATNACVENRGGRAKLVFFGGDAKVIDENGAKYGLPASKDMLIQDCGTTFSGTIEREPDWESFREHISTGFDGLDGVGIIEMNAMRNGAAIEKRAKAIFQEARGPGQRAVPVICGHELFSELNCLQRGSSTLLNARLFPVIVEFLDAIKRALAARNMEAALVIVRSDGSLMSEEFAATRPVETLLCGPAASAIGGARLTGRKNCVVVDMGGTTTDIALVRDGAPVTVVDGVSVGKWKTFVDGLYVKTFGLGGDSAVHYSGGGLFLEDYRVVPLCVAASEYPSVLDNLKKLDLRKNTKFLYEHYILVKDIADDTRYSAEEKAFCAALRGGPLSVSQAAEAVGKDVYSLDVKRLIRDGVVQMCGVTPTDIMHIRGDFGRYCAEASMLGVEFAAFNLDISVEEFCERVYGEVKRKIYLNVVKVMLENKYPGYMRDGVGGEAEKFINESYEAARTGRRDGLLHMAFNTEYALVGIGAPIRVFIGDVAKMLGADAVIPEHYEVANALGAVVGNISAGYDVEIRPIDSVGGIVGYTVYGSGGARIFEELGRAVEFARADAVEVARNEAVSRGAKGEITVTCSISDNDAEIRGGTVRLGTTVSAQAVGAAGF